MKIGIIGTAGIPAKYGGFETLAEYLTDFKHEELEFLVFCSKEAGKVKVKTHNGARLKYLPLKANGIQSIPYDVLSILIASRKVDTLLILGVSGTIILPVLRLFSNKKIVLNLDGLEWKRDKWGKLAKKYLKFSERIGVKYADKVVADNKVIKEHVENTYRKSAIQIAYGADHAVKVSLTFGTLERFPFLKNPYAFKVCRIEPENNIELILKAFSQTPFNLVLVGNWNVSKHSQNLRLKYEKLKNLFLLDPIYDQVRLNEIRSNCSVYVHGHSAGGTNPSLVEAMYLGLPILAYGVSYNKETTSNKALYFESTEDLISLLQQTNSERLESIGVEMQSIAQKNYTWQVVSDAYSKLFQ